MKDFQVAIDGPAGSGKSTISHKICQKLGFTHIDTGAMYRAVTLEALNRKIDLNNEEEYKFLEETVIEYKDDKIFLNGKDVDEEIRSAKVASNVSLVSSFPYVREKMVEIQKSVAEHGLVIMDGRDIGTVVLPHANVKIFLTATVEQRALRRHKENVAKGKVMDYMEVLEAIKTRDFKDSTRALNPLRQAADAILMDTTNMTIDEVAGAISAIISERLK